MASYDPTQPDDAWKYGDPEKDPATGDLDDGDWNDLEDDYEPYDPEDDESWMEDVP